MAKATDGLAFGITRHCRIEGLPPMPPTPMKQGSMDRAKGFTHIPQEIKNGNHHASIHAVHFGNLDPGKCRNFCTFGILELLVRLEHFKQELNDPE